MVSHAVAYCKNARRRLTTIVEFLVIFIVDCVGLLVLESLSLLDCQSYKVL